MPELPGPLTQRWVDAHDPHKARFPRRSRLISRCNKSAPYVTHGPMNTTALSTRRPRRVNPKGGTLQQSSLDNRCKLPERLEMAEQQAEIAKVRMDAKAVAIELEETQEVK